MFWLPEMIRSDLATRFFKIQDEKEFWEFLKQDIGDTLFFEDLLA
jgi:hypothetical protein